MIKFHDDGTLPLNGEVLVFGSNLAGIHGAGAARVAHKEFGALWGNGIGLHAQSYAIPTKNEDINTLDLTVITDYVSAFITETINNPGIQWFVTRVGCGLAGYTDEDIAPLFKGAKNCSFAKEWKLYLENADEA